MMKIKDLHANPKNPRTITEPKLAMLRAALLEFGDLGGFVFNRKSKQLVGGHQRAKLFDKNAGIVIEKKYPKPTRTGTVAEGYVVLSGERFRYREVSWGNAREKAANIAANNGAGAWDMPQLAEWIKDLNEDGFDLRMTMFDNSELEGIFAELTSEEAAAAPPADTLSDAAEEEALLRGGVQRVILFFEPAQYENLSRLAAALMEAKGLEDMSALFIHLLEHAAAAHAALEPDQKKRRKKSRS